jgi:hypothetical protein
MMNPPLPATPTPPGPDELTEALAQLYVIAAAEDERRKTTDAKLSAAQNAIGFIVTLAGGSVALAFLQTPIYDLWHAVVIVALTVSVGFFVWAAHKIVQANDPAFYQSRIAGSVRRLLDAGKSKQELQRDAIDDLVANIDVNTETTNKRLTLYRAAIQNIRKGVIAAGSVPFVVLLAYGINAVSPQPAPFLRVNAAVTTGSPASLAPINAVTALPGVTPMPALRESNPHRAH